MGNELVLDKTYLASKWWILTIRGILAILTGIAFVFWPGITLVTLVYLFGGYVLVSGILSLLEGLFTIGRKGRGASWVLTLLLGAVQLGVGVYLLRHPTVTFATLIILIGLALVAYAVFEIIASLADKESTSTARVLAMISAIAAGVAGIFVLMQPVASGVAFVWILGVFSLISGPIAIALSLDVKRLHDQLEAKKK